eukprot:symbB.v1.2.020762.t1/scaffold1749.1/size103200/2
MRDDYYELLGIRSNATAKEIGRAFRKASLKLHPDKLVACGVEETSAAEEAFAAVREAYDTLSDPVARDRYDKRARWMSSHPDQIRAAIPTPLSMGPGQHFPRAATADALMRREVPRCGSSAVRRPSTGSGLNGGVLGFRRSPEPKGTLKDFFRQWPQEKGAYMTGVLNFRTPDFPAPMVYCSNRPILGQPIESRK